MTYLASTKLIKVVRVLLCDAWYRRRTTKSTWVLVTCDGALGWRSPRVSVVWIVRVRLWLTGRAVDLKRCSRIVVDVKICRAYVQPTDECRPLVSTTEASRFRFHLHNVRFLNTYARRPYNLYCVGGDVKPCSISISFIHSFIHVRLR